MSKRGTPGSKGAAAKAQATQRRARALELRTQGATHAQIAEDLCVSEERARQLVLEALKEVAAHTQEVAAHWRDLELERLERVHQSLAAALVDAEPAVASKICAQIVRASESRRKLLGLDAPTKVQVEAEVAPLDAERVQQLRAALRGAG